MRRTTPQHPAPPRSGPTISLLRFLAAVPRALLAFARTFLGALSSRFLRLARWWRDWAPSIAILAAGVWAYFQFIYKEIQLPLSKPAYVNVTLAMEPAGPHPIPLQPIRCSITLSNPAETEIYLLCAYYAVEGDIYRQDTLLSNPQFAERVSQHIGHPGQVHPIHRSAVEVTRQFLCGGRHPSELRPLSGGETAVYAFVTYVPRDSFDLLRLTVHAIASRKNAGLVPNWQVAKNGQIAVKAARFVGYIGGQGQYEYTDILPPDYVESIGSTEIAMIRHSALPSQPSR